MTEIQLVKGGPEVVAIKAALAEKRTTITQIAPKIGTTYDILSNVINGRTRADMELLESLRKELGKPKGWPFNAETGIQSLSGTTLRPIKVVGKVQAGPGRRSDDSPPFELLVPGNMVGEDRGGMEIEGLSMAPNLEPGDIGIFKLGKVPRKGFVQLVRDVNGDPIVKQMQVSAGKFVLHSFNEEFFPDVEVVAGMEVLGTLVGLYRIYGSEELIRHDPNGLRF